MPLRVGIGYSRRIGLDKLTTPFNEIGHQGREGFLGKVGDADLDLQQRALPDRRWFRTAAPARGARKSRKADPDASRAPVAETESADAKAGKSSAMTRETAADRRVVSPGASPAEPDRCRPNRSRRRAPHRRYVAGLA